MCTNTDATEKLTLTLTPIPIAYWPELSGNDPDIPIHVLSVAGDAR